jgi:hypothetical protein
MKRLQQVVKIKLRKEHVNHQRKGSDVKKRRIGMQRKFA